MRQILSYIGLFALILIPVKSVDAQFMGPFFGPAFAPFQSPTEMVQNRRPITQNVGGPVTTSPVRPNAYWNYLREPVQNYSLTPRNDIRRGVRGIESASTRSQNTNTGKDLSTKPKSPKTHFLGFFDSNGRLVWPNDAPLEGELSGKRAIVDSTLTGLRAEAVSTHPITVSAVVSSRNDLLDYGRPALAHLREYQPNRSDSFHKWLLDLYNTLGQLTQ
jgi:hypothetical protein